MLGFIGVLFIFSPPARTSAGRYIPVAAAFASSVRDILASGTYRRLDGHPVLVFTGARGRYRAHRAFRLARGFASIVGFFLLAGFVNFCARFLLIESFRLARAAVVAPLKYTSLLWSAVLGYVIWGDLPTGWVWLGSAILVASGLWIAQTQRH
jgi:drug/metabolite transporter (DMT)-like permease